MSMSRLKGYGSLGAEPKVVSGRDRGHIKVTNVGMTAEASAAHQAARDAAMRVVSHEGGVSTVVRGLTAGAAPGAGMPVASSGGMGGMMTWLLVGGGVLAVFLLTKKRKKG